MKNQFAQYLGMLTLIFVSCNPDQFGIVISRITAIAFSLFLFLLIPNSPCRRSGRYMASVTVSEYGQVTQLWAQNYQFRLLATFMAHRAALRYDFLGDVYSTFDIVPHVEDLSHKKPILNPDSVCGNALS